MTKITIEEQIKEVARELALRERVYPKWIADGKVKQEQADYSMARMRAVMATLEWVRMNREAIIKATEK